MTKFDPTALPQIRRWLEHVQPDPSKRRISTFVTANTTLAGAAALSAIYFPRFKKYRGCYLIDEGAGGKLSPHRRDAVDGWLTQLGDDLGAVERLVNHLRPADLYINDPDADDEGLSYLAEVLAFSWAIAAGQQFPAQEFRTLVEYGVDPEVTIFAIR